MDPATLIAAYHQSWRERLLGGGVAETVERLTRQVGGDQSPDQVSRAAGLRYALARRVLAAVPVSTLAALDGLRAGGHRLALISNATADSAEVWPEGPLAGRFDVAVFSCEVGLAKPDPAIYRLAASRLGADPGACVFVGDGADGELAGAAATGMTVVRTIEHQDTDPGWPGPVVTAIGQLPGLLARLSATPG